MKAAAILLLLLCSAAPRLTAQDTNTAPPEQKAWLEYMTPGPMQEMLKSHEGKWKVTASVWMKPGDPPLTSDGDAESKMIFDGRYLQSEFHGTMMGQKFEGMGLDAYDNALGEFRSVWIDNMGTGIMMLRGKMDPATKTISYEGTVVDPQTKKEIDTWSTITMTDADHQTMEMFSKIEGKKVKTMEMKYERAK